MAKLCAIDLGLAWAEPISVPNFLIASDSKVSSLCLISYNCVNHIYMNIVNKCTER